LPPAGSCCGIRVLRDKRRQPLAVDRDGHHPAGDPDVLRVGDQRRVVDDGTDPAARQLDLDEGTAGAGAGKLDVPAGRVDVLLPGYNSFMGYDPDSKITVVVWASMAPTVDGNAPAVEMAKAVIGELYTTP
jgi:hypothetical protein